MMSFLLCQVALTAVLCSRFVEASCTEDRILEKVISIELKSELVLQKLERLNTSTTPGPISPYIRPPALRVVDLEYDGWELVFRATSGTGHSAYDAWTTGLNTCDTKPVTMERSHGCHYRDPAVSTWTGVNMVKFALYNRDQEVAFVTFNGVGSNTNTWFQASNVLSSSWSDLTSSSEFNYFSIAGHVEHDHFRRFFINRNYGGCGVDLGHIAVIDKVSTRCDWDRQPVYPQFLYSQINSVDRWNVMQFGRSDYLAIFIKTTLE